MVDRRRRKKTDLDECHSLSSITLISLCYDPAEGRADTDVREREIPLERNSLQPVHSVQWRVFVGPFVEVLCCEFDLSLADIACVIRAFRISSDVHFASPLVDDQNCQIPDHGTWASGWALEFGFGLPFICL